MTNLKAIKDFGITEDQLLDLLILYENRKMEASKKLVSLLFDKWRITTLDAVKIIEALKKELKL